MGVKMEIEAHQLFIMQCNQQIAKHGTMTMLDGISLLIDAFSGMNRR